MNYPSLDEINSQIHKFTSPKFLKSNYPEFYDFIKTTYPQTKKMSEGMYLFYHNMTQPKCPICGIDLKFKSWSEGYRQFCSVKCASIGSTTKREQTCLERYGAKTMLAADGFKEKSKQTCLKKYGVEWAQQSAAIMNKSKQTCLERYGVTRPNQNADIMNHIKKDMEIKYGGMGFGSQVINIKIQKTNLQKYGDSVAIRNQNVKDKIATTKIKKYGDAGYNNRNKSKQTCIERYGVDNFTKSGQCYNKNCLYSTEEVVGYTDDNQWICKCNKSQLCNGCDGTYVTPRGVHYDRKRNNAECCTKLNPINSFTSTLELFVMNILNEYQIPYILHCRNIVPKHELDIYIPGLNLAIECNGIYWHSDKIKSKDYHIKKLHECNNYGIQLIQLWEDWIINSPEIIKSMIVNKIRKTKNSIYARQCTIRQISSPSKFYDSNHIQGGVRAKVHLGLFYRDELVSVMSFNVRSKLSGPKKVNEGEWELVRFCSKINTNVVGSASKLLSYFIKTFNPKSIISFSQNDISSGNVYKKLGFEKDHESTSYWYINRNLRRYHRSTFSKMNLVKKGYDKNLTEKQITDTIGLYRIYDSGTTKWILKLN